MNKGKRNIISLSFPLVVTIFFFSVWACITPSIRQTMEQNSGDEYFYEHQYSEAIDHYLHMLEASSKLGIYRNTSMESEVWRKIANCYEMMGKYSEAMDGVRNAMALDSADRNRLNLIEDYRHEGMISVYMGSYYKGISSLEKSLEMSAGMENSLKNTRRLLIAETYLALGKLYAVMGKTRDALDYTARALSIYRSAGDSRGEMESYLNLANVYSDLGDMNEARKFTEISMRIAEENDLGTSRHNQLLASVAVTGGEYEKGIRYQERALGEAKKYGIAAQVVWTTIGLGDIYSELGEVERAEKYYNDARAAKDTISMIAGSLEASLGLRLGDLVHANRYFDSEGSLTGRAISTFRMAELMIMKEEKDSAMTLLKMSGNSFASAGNLQGLSNVQVMEAKLHIEEGNNLMAGILLDSALSSSPFPETVWQAYFQKGRMYEAMEREIEAIGCYKKSVEVIEKIRGNLTIDEFKSSFFDSKREVYDRLIQLLLKNENPVDAFRYSEQARARAFYDILANRKIDFRGSLPGDLVLREQEKRIEMQNLYKLLQKNVSGGTNSESSRQSDAEQIREALMKAQSEYEDILQKIKLNNPAYAEMVAAQPVDIHDLQSELDGSTAMLAYWLSDKEIIIWMITDSSVVGHNTLISREKINSLVESTRLAIKSNKRDEATSGLSKLYNILISPLEDKVAGFSNLIIIPNGPLHLLPFQALINGSGRYLVEGFNILYTPSAGVYKVCNNRKVESGSSFMGLALADVSLDNRSGLPGTAEELSNILPLFTTKTSASGLQGTETFVKLNAGSYDIIHFATHGSYNYRQPLYSCLLFPPSDDDDGRLNVFEVFEMNIKAKLVTLSACETGLGYINRGDELTGLSRAFLFAGSSSVIVSLWAVADYPTSLLMTNFYRYLKDHPMQEALTLAQRDVLKLFPQPLYWSPFVLIGNGNITAG